MAQEKTFYNSCRHGKPRKLQYDRKTSRSWNVWRQSSQGQRKHFLSQARSFLVLDGAESHDKEFRKLNENFWEQELWSDEEEQSCLNRIEEHGRTADYILSHTGPIEGISLIESSCDDPKYRELYRMDKTVRFNDKVNEIMSYKKWFFGHWHTSWGYDHRKHSKFIPLFTAGIVLDNLEDK